MIDCSPLAPGEFEDDYIDEEYQDRLAEKGDDRYDDRCLDY